MQSLGARMASWLLKRGQNFRASLIRTPRNTGLGIRTGNVALEAASGHCPSCNHSLQPPSTVSMAPAGMLICVSR